MMVLKILAGIVMGIGIVAVFVIAAAILIRHLPAQARQAIRGFFSGARQRMSGTNVNVVELLTDKLPKLMIGVLYFCVFLIVLPIAIWLVTASWSFFFGEAENAASANGVPEAVPVPVPVRPDSNEPPPPEPGVDWREDYVIALGEEIRRRVDCEILPTKVSFCYNPAKHGRLLHTHLSLALKKSMDVETMQKGSHMSLWVSPADTDHLIWFSSTPATGEGYKLVNDYCYPVFANDGIVVVGWKEGEPLKNRDYLITLEHATLYDQNGSVRRRIDGGVPVLQIVIPDVRPSSSVSRNLVNIGKIPTTVGDMKVEADVEVILFREDGCLLEGGKLQIIWDGELISDVGPRHRLNTLNRENPELQVAHAYSEPVSVHLAVRPR